ncbi:hypothetical protein [Paraburkholderia sp. GAS42]|jgi:hypothetical protein|uniref:hypothetical protein n=1 Tax=Paraburkholderia sp. GAS42 TaxID=3035135 RepID=UPI003D1C6347
MRTRLQSRLASRKQAPVALAVPHGAVHSSHLIANPGHVHAFERATPATFDRTSVQLRDAMQRRPSKIATFRHTAGWLTQNWREAR